MALSPKHIIGRITKVDFPRLGALQISAKVDTGAYRTVVHCEWAKVIRVRGERRLKVLFQLPGGVEKTIRFRKFNRRTIKNSFGEKESRYCVSLQMNIEGHAVRSSVSLTDRSGMRYPVLIGRKTLRGRFLVDVAGSERSAGHT